MANSPDKPKDDGEIGLPRIDGGQNKTPPALSRKKKLKKKGIRPVDAPPAYSDSNHPDDNMEPETDDDRKGTDKAAKPEKEDTDDEILTRIRKRMERCIAWESDNRKEALEDLKFKKGTQWPADVAAQRNTDNRPCLTINKIPTFIHQVTNDQRQNRPSINVSPVGEKGDMEAAKMFRGMIRAIERDSSADIAYDTAFDSAVSNGFGYIRLLTEFESPKSLQQIILVKRVRNPFTVYLDPDHQEPDGADCEFGFVTEWMPRDEFKDKFPDANPIPFTQQGVGEGYKDWSTKDTIRVAEYFEIKHEKHTLVELENGWTGYEDDLDDDVKAKVASKRILVRRQRETTEPKVKWYKVTAMEVLERNDWLGQWIPIIPVIGNELDIEGKVALSGLIRDAKDAQRVYNFSVTAEIELVALAPKAPWIVEEGQMEGHEQEWKQANQKNFPYLSYKGTSVAGRPAPPPQRQQMVGSPIGWVNLKMGAAQDMMATTGVRWDATHNEQRVDDSGRAIREMRRSTDVGSFHYVDNLMRSLKHIGRQFVDLIPKIYDEKQVVTILREDGVEELITLDPNAHKPYDEGAKGANGKKMKIFNPNVGKYGVAITIGPSFATKRIEAAESMMAFAKALPNTATLIADLIAKNQDWPGAEQMAERLAKAVPPHLLTPDMKDVPPQVQAVIQSMDAQIKQLNQQLQAAMAALNDKDKDRAIALEKIHLDFEKGILGVMQKAEASFDAHVGSSVKDLAKDIQLLTSELGKSNTESAQQSAS